MTLRPPSPRTRRRARPWRAVVAVALACVMATVASGVAGAQTPPDAPTPPSTPPSLPPGLPTVDNPTPTDPAEPAPPPEPPIPDPSPKVAVLVAQLHVLDTQALLMSAQGELDRAAAAQAAAQQAVDRLTAARDARQAQLQGAAVNTYIAGGLDEVGPPTGLDEVSDFVPSESARLLVTSALQLDHAKLVKAEADLRAGQDVLDQATAATAQATAVRDSAQAAVDDAIHAVDVARGARGDASPTVMGPPILTAEEIAGWYRSQGVSGWAVSVDLPTLAGYYVDEGTAEQIRGDVAFAQSMVETGAFTSPLTTHNNFAGIGACDSCATGFDFPSPQLGVRAQAQLLHSYADRSLTVADLAHPAIGANPDHLSVRGCCTTWNALTGTWATDPNYGPKIMTIYLSMLQYAYAQRTAAPPAAPPPAP